MLLGYLGRGVRIGFRAGRVVGSAGRWVVEEWRDLQWARYSRLRTSKYLGDGRGSAAGGMEEKKDERKSRVPKLDTIPPDHLVLIAREWLKGDVCNNSSGFVMRVLASATARGSEEAAWLLDVITRGDGSIPEFGVDWTNKCRWLAESLVDDDTARAQYYRGRALDMIGDTRGLELLRRSAASGFSAAMSVLGWRMISTKQGEGMEWLQRGAELNDANGLCWLSQFDVTREFSLRLSAEKHGHFGTMWILAEKHADKFDAVSRAALRARYALWSGSRVAVFEADSALRLISELRAGKEEWQIVFAVGRELEGFEQVWDEERHLTTELQKCVEFFVTVAHRARRAALQAVAALRFLGLSKDVAVLIAKLVYKTRDDAQIWLARVQ